MIQASTLPESYKAKAISIINEKPELVNYNHEDGQQVDNRIIKLKALQSGEVWRVIETQFFSQMRNACAVIVTVRTQPKEEPAPAPSTSSPKESTPLLYSPELSPAQADEPAKPLNLTLKTNLIGLAAVIGNVGVEIDIAEHWSVTLPIYYSSLDYFKSTLKFRTFCAQPELRYWFKGNDGWFVGAHAGIAWYNFALDGKWRFQDHKGRTPMFDKGIGAGYRTALGKHSRWALEFTLGCGTGNLKYDRFINVPNGQKVTTIEKTFIGIDNAAVSLCYRFDIKRRNK